MPNKYHNVRTEVDGYNFASKKEAIEYSVLNLRQRAGEISDLSIQPKFTVDVNGKHICDYIADFSYIENGTRVVEDVKGVRTAVYRLKKKLVEAIYGVTITET